MQIQGRYLTEVLLHTGVWGSSEQEGWVYILWTYDLFAPHRA